MLDEIPVVTTNFKCKLGYHLQMGNQMFLYCSCRFYASQLGCSFSFPRNWEGSNFIECDIGKENVGNNVIILTGYFQNVSYTNKSWFTVKNLNLIDKYDFNNWCIIHFRGTDNLCNSLDKDYYKLAMEKMKSINKNFKFLAITDDINNCKNYVDADDYQSNTKEQDFKLLMLSKYTILSRSTFSWWATFLSNTNIFCIGPSGWRKPTDQLLYSPHIHFVI